MRYTEKEKYSFSDFDGLASEFARIYRGLFPGEPVMSMEKFIKREPEEILITLEDAFGLYPDKKRIESLNLGITEMVNLGEDIIDAFSEDHPQRESVLNLLVRMMYLRAYVLIGDEQFCEAAMETDLAVLTLKKTVQYYKDRQRLLNVALVMFQGLMNSVFVRHYSKDNYVPSDCLSNCGYCQDPIATLAQQGAKTLRSVASSSNPSRQIAAIWGVAAAMLAAYMTILGGDPLSGKFPKDLHPGVKMAFRLMVRDAKPAEFPWIEMIGDYQLMLVQ